MTAFLYVMDKEEEAFYCLKALLRLCSDAFPPAQDAQRNALCVSLLRSLLPQLSAHLERMFVDTSLWLPSWLRFLLSVELPLPSLLRLWDFYFSDDDCVQLHMFVCLGMLQVNERLLRALASPLSQRAQAEQDTLLDLNDASDIYAHLTSLPGGLLLLLLVLLLLSSASSLCLSQTSTSTCCCRWPSV